jgi:putative ABC transport system permease protein
VTLTQLAFRNLWRNRIRTVLTILGVAVAVLAFVTLRTLVWSWTSSAEFAAKDRVVTRHKVTFVMPLPKRYVDDIRTMPQVKKATWANWFGGKDPAHDTEFFGNFAVDADTYFDVYDEMQVPPEDLARWKQNKSGAIVGDVLAKKLGWKVGDRVTLESGIYPAAPDTPWVFTIEGIYLATRKSVDRSSFMFHWSMLNDSVAPTMREQVGWVVSRVQTPAQAAQNGVEIDRVFDERDTQTLSQDEAAFNASFLAGISTVLRAIDFVSLIIMVIMMLVLGNTIAMGVRERTFEYGVLRAMGFTPRHILSFVLGEAMFVGLLGGVLGLAIAYPFVNLGLGRFLEENMGNFFVYFRMPTLVAAAAMGLALLLALVAAILPARSAARVNVTDALRRVA